MRQVIIMVTIVLMLVATLGSPVASRVTPYDPNDPMYNPGPEGDHPWGGEDGTPGGGDIIIVPSSTKFSTGYLTLDMVFHLFVKPMVIRKYDRGTIIVKPQTNSTTQQNTGVTPNLAN